MGVLEFAVLEFAKIVADAQNSTRKVNLIKAIRNGIATLTCTDWPYTSRMVFSSDSRTDFGYLLASHPNAR